MTTPKESPSERVNIYDVFKYAKEERHAFLTADLLFGSAALWLPTLLGLMFLSRTSPLEEFIKLLDSGGGYTFALAYLAAGSSFLYLERRKDIINSFREDVWPNVWTWCQFSLVIGLALTGAHFAAQILEPGKRNCILNIAEFLYLVGAVWLGIRLFCLKNIDALPGKLAIYQAREEAKAKEIAKAANSNAAY